jgi:1,4-dihydroxy-2-naphthoate octaprenyltransferase
MELTKKKALIIIICTCGICALAYGMANGDNTIFLIGLMLVIIGYLYIRKELKSSTKGKPEKDS